jgi:hypothetical protein
MDALDKVSKQKAHQLIHYLRDKRVLLKLVVKNTGYESVTVVTDIESIDKQSCFRIDCADDFHIILKSRDRGNLVFEFNGPDKVLYTFETPPDPEWRRGEVWIPIPDEIDRIQRRRNFRLEAPMGTELILRQLHPPLKMVVVDFSLGGLLCVVESARERIKKNLMLTRGRRLKNLELLFRQDNVTTKIRVTEASIVRVETNPVTGYRQYAFQFLSMEKSEEKSLTKVLYRMQRQILRQRLPLKDE